MEVDHWGIEQEEHNESPLAHVLQYGTSSNPILKQAALIYSSITDVIGIERARGPSGPTAYFAAFLSALQQKGKHSLDTLSAFCYLLAHIYPHLSNSVIISKAEETAELYIDILKNHAEIVYVTKNLLFCLSKNLRVLGNGDMKRLTSPIALKMLRTLLIFSIDPRPKIRHDAQKNCTSFFRHISNNQNVLPQSVCESIVNFADAEISACDRKDCQTALYLCGLLKDTIQFLPTSSVAKIIAPLLKLAAEGNPYLVLQTFNVLTKLFQHGFIVSRVIQENNDKSRQLISHLKLGASDIANRCNRDAEFIDNVLLSIFDLKPNITDANSSASFANAIKTGYTILYQFSPSKALARISSLYELMAESFTSENQKVLQSTGSAIRVMMKATFNNDSVTQALTTSDHVLHSLVQRTQELFSAHIRFAWNESMSITQTIVSSCDLPETLHIVKPLLIIVDNIQRTSDEKSFVVAAERVVGSAIKSMGPEAVLSVLPLNLPILSDTHSVIEQLELARPWILPILALNVKYTSLQYYIANILPFADAQLQLAGIALSSQPSRPTEARTVITIAEQIWDCLPAFCTVPTDLAKVFKPFARKLAEYIQNDDTAFAQPVICKALRLLACKNIAIAEGRWNQGNDLGMNRIIFDDEGDDVKTKNSKNKVVAKSDDTVDEDYDVTSTTEDSVDTVVEVEEEVAQEDKCPITKAEAIENVKALGSVAKNILPLLFNLASTALPIDRAIVLDTILAYTHVADVSVKSSLFKRALERFIEATRNLNDAYVKFETQDDLTEADESKSLFANFRDRISPDEINMMSDTAKALADILMSMAPGLDGKCLELLVRAVLSEFNSGDVGMQRKAYQTVGHVMTVNQDVFNSLWKDVVRALTLGHANVLSGAIKARLVCSMRIYSAIPNLLSHPEVLETLPAIISESILASKENSAKTRLAAFELVTTVGRRLLNAQGSDLLTEYLYMVIAGLASSTPRMKSGTITMLACLIYEFKNDISQELMHELFSTIVVMISSKTREIIKALMGFIKVAITVLNPELIKANIKNLLQAFADWTPDTKSRFKRKVRLIFTILIKKFGFDYIKNVTPTNDVRLVDYLKKQYNRQQKIKEVAKKADKKEHTMDDDDEEDAVKTRSGLSFEEFMNMDDDDDDDNSSPLSAADYLQSKIDSKGKNDNTKVWIGENTDFMDAGLNNNLYINNAPKSGGVNMADVQALATKRSMPMTSDGKMDITSLSKHLVREEEENKRAKRRRDVEEDPKIAAKKKREDREQALKDKQSAIRDNALGKAFASDKAGGDARRKGQKHDPYAYMPLDPRTLNKRKATDSIQAATYAAAFSSKVQGKKLGQKMNRAQRVAIRKKGGRS